MADIGDFMRHDQVAGRIDGNLHIVADDPSALAARGHRTGIWISERNLLIRRSTHRDFHLLELLHLLLQRRDFIFQPDRFRLRDLALLPVGGIECG